MYRHEFKSIVENILGREPGRKLHSLVSLYNIRNVERISHTTVALSTPLDRLITVTTVCLPEFLENLFPGGGGGITKASGWTSAAGNA
jgi:hypothetical protein